MRDILSERADLAWSLNRDAGTHLVTGHPGERDAALRAAERSLAEFPYYVRRYGERGRRFAGSDGGWLAMLCDASAGDALRQVLWLGTVLASRGMPRWLLERHLDVLHEELVRAVPERAPRYAVMAHCAAELRALRLARLSDDALRELDDAFAGRVGAPWADEHPRMGAILAAAVADEADGLAQAVPSVETWAADTAVFPARWVKAAQLTIRDARARRG